MRHTAARPGFALLMTLMLVAVVAIALASLARWSMLRAVEVQDATEEVQRRWAMTSCQATLLPRIPALLDQVERPHPAAPEKSAVAEWRVSCRLSGLDCELLFTDEQAKLNINQVFRKSGAPDARAAATQLLSRALLTAGPGAKLHWRPTVLAGGTSQDSLPPVGTYDQFLDRVSPTDLFGTPHRPGLAATVTCWGDGRVSIRRAPPAVLQQVCDGTLPRAQTTALLTLRQDDPFRKLPAILGAVAGLDDKQKSKLGQLLTDDSTTFGLAIRMNDVQRSWFTWTVAEGAFNPAAASSPKTPRTFRINRIHNFAW